MKITRRQLRKLITETIAGQFVASLPKRANDNSNLDSEDDFDFGDQFKPDLEWLNSTDEEKKDDGTFYKDGKRHYIGTDDEIIRALGMDKVSLFDVTGYSDENLKTIKENIANYIKELEGAIETGFFNNDYDEKLLSSYLSSFNRKGGVENFFSKQKSKKDDLYHQMSILSSITGIPINRGISGGRTELGRLLAELRPVISTLKYEFKNFKFKL